MSGEMRTLSKEEQERFGCEYCTESVGAQVKTRKCKHKVCPYAEQLLKYKSYKDYDKDTQVKMRDILDHDIEEEEED